MPTQPQRLLQLATELQRLEPWTHVGERSVFLIQVPGTAAPVSVTIFGDTVDVMGMEVSLEPDGFQRLAKLHDPDTSDDEIEAFKPGRALSLVFLPPGQIPPDFRKVWKAAAFRPSGSRPAPQFAATDGGSEIRPIKRSEGTILGYCLHAVVDALAHGRLYPPDIADGAEAALLLRVPGDDPEEFEGPSLPEAEVDVVGWPDATGVLPAPHSISAANLTALEALAPGEKLLAAVWFVSDGAEQRSVSAGTHVMLLLDPENEELVASMHLSNSDADALESGLAELFEAAGERPAGCIVEDADLALVAFPICRALGIAPHLGEFDGELAHLVDDHVREFGGAPRPRLRDTIDGLEAIGGERIPTEFPAQLETRADWEAGFRHASASLLIDAQGTGALAEATHAYWGGARQQARTLELMGSLGAMHAFLGYALEDHTASGFGRTVLEDYLDQARGADGIGAAEIALLEARQHATVSLFEVAEGAEIATDLTDGASFPIDIDLDDAGRFAGHVLLMRRYELGGFQAFGIAGFPFPSAAQSELMDRVTGALKAKPTHELLRARGAALGALWQQSVTHLDGALKSVRGA